MRPASLLALACVVALLLASAFWWVRGASATRITAYFDKAIGLYAGSAVRVLGVKVGQIDSVVPQGGQVRVEFTVDSAVEIPAAVHAVVIAPSLVSDRYVQLTPAYDSGAKLASTAVIPRERTASPVELDQLFRSVNDLSAALGPNGANKSGALSNLLSTAAATLAGTGEDLNQAIKQLSSASATLNTGKDDLFGTVDNLNKVSTLLAASDDQVRQLDRQLADASGFLAADRDQFGAALTSLASALGQVQKFVTDNKGLVQSNVDKLTAVSKALVDQRAALAEVLDVAPTAATNFINAYDAASGSIAVRGNINELTYPPTMMLCQLLQRSTPTQLPQVLGDLCKQLAPLLDGTLHLPSAADILAALQQGKLPPLPLPIGGGR
ncbi:MCE family protein [Kutzneria viridogrisea]|uniref:ABC transporter substrate-binding protein n=2 Tax=Kutzneria TaxID=43356 RepID=W5W7A9_9PSEU|nr:MCE family protein [Kutzneria albida]AHH96792.1 ABC transporter substrate-binding protein [Kutzneria albida DSM 43870]MBA8927989.1 virulence factor Mce-like protein [Kutzneria viridogrisea]